MSEVREFCGEWIEEKVDRCNAPAEFILWGKLFPAEALGPRCYDHAAKHTGHWALSPSQLPQCAIFDLRGLQRVSV